MKEYFIVATSFAAPFFSDTSKEYHKGSDPEQVLNTFARLYSHPARLFAAYLYPSADAFQKGKKATLTWLSKAAIAQMQGKEVKKKDKYEGEIYKDTWMLYR
jgi:hypothetical protein